MSEFRVRYWCPPEDLPKSRECLYLFAGVLFLNAFLLFWVQPLFARMVLPVLVVPPRSGRHACCSSRLRCWSAMRTGHAGLRWFGIRRQAAIHSVIVWIPLLLLPIEVTQVGAALATQEPITWLLTIVATTVGLPFVVLASTAPLLQRWFSAAAVARRIPTGCTPPAMPAVSWRCLRFRCCSSHCSPLRCRHPSGRSVTASSQRC